MNAGNGTKPARQAQYTPETVFVVLAEYQRLVLTGRLPGRSERLSTRPAPVGEASWSATARLKADIETAWKALPMEQALILFHYVCLGRSSWRSGRMVDWREKVGDWWDKSAGEVNAETREAIEAICSHLNGGRVRAPDGTS